MLQMEGLAKAEATASSVARIIHDLNPDEMFKHISKHLPKNHKQRIYLKGPEGASAPSIIEHKQIFREYVAGMMCADTKSFQEHIEGMRQRVASRNILYDVSADAATAISLSLIPSVAALTSRFSHLKPKALGESG
eukprot:1299728-Karenia_brevis.AAC.1